MPGIAWFKITDPDRSIPVFPAGADVRVLLPEGDEFAILAEIGSSAPRARIGTPAG